MVLGQRAKGKGQRSDWTTYKNVFFFFLVCVGKLTVNMVKLNIKSPLRWPLKYLNIVKISRFCSRRSHGPGSRSSHWLLPYLVILFPTWINSRKAVLLHAKNCCNRVWLPVAPDSSHVQLHSVLSWKKGVFGQYVGKQLPTIVVKHSSAQSLTTSWADKPSRGMKGEILISSMHKASIKWQCVK